MLNAPRIEDGELPIDLRQCFLRVEFATVGFRPKLVLPFDYVLFCDGLHISSGKEIVIMLFGSVDKIIQRTLFYGISSESEIFTSGKLISDDVFSVVFLGSNKVFFHKLLISLFGEFLCLEAAQKFLFATVGSLYIKIEVVKRSVLLGFDCCIAVFNSLRSCEFLFFLVFATRFMM